MHFLIVNDDGINSPLSADSDAGGQACRASGDGLRASDAAERKGTCIQHRAADSGGEARSCPMRMKRGQFSVRRWTCCRIGAMNLAPDADAVISGINLGYNVGMSVYVSGTVGAAREATFLHKPGIAVSAEKQSAARHAGVPVRLGRRDGGEAGHARRAGTDGVQPERAADSPRGAEKSGAVPAEPRRRDRDSYEQRISPRKQTYFWALPNEAGSTAAGQ